MRRRLLLLLVVLTGLHFSAVYGFIVVHWMENVSTDVYKNHPTEAFCETSLLLIYSMLGIRLARKRFWHFVKTSK
jgi:hypothetical protein